MNTRRTRRFARGFSLLELTLVLAIIGVLMAVAAVNILGTGERANVRATEATLRTVGSQIESYYLEHKVYPDSLRTLVVAQFLKDEGSMFDAWKQELWYQPIPDTTGNPFTLQSAGKDRNHGTEDDLVYWRLNRP
ncbi:MAG: type II secretion system protein GspG [Phycisphaeraceae bacterium]|nr:type II secretion system protein GspG [Phycisphaeraceae bacterium]MCW5754860.1 type II secretion system protein GspG [Phycisphaeraceae bacterium]